MKLCDRCRVAGCLLNYGGKACKNARKKDCPDVVFTNAERVREMNDEELAKFMLGCDGAAYCRGNGSNRTCYMRICFAMLESADTAVFLPDWEDGPGAQLEKHWCEYVGKKMVFLMEG